MGRGRVTRQPAALGIERLDRPAPRYGAAPRRGAKRSRRIAATGTRWAAELGELPLDPVGILAQERHGPAYVCEGQAFWDRERCVTWPEGEPFWPPERLDFDAALEDHGRGCSVGERGAWGWALALLLLGRRAIHFVSPDASHLIPEVGDPHRSSRPRRRPPDPMAVTSETS